MKLNKNKVQKIINKFNQIYPQLKNKTKVNYLKNQKKFNFKKNKIKKTWKLIKKKANINKNENLNKIIF